MLHQEKPLQLIWAKRFEAIFSIHPSRSQLWRTYLRTLPRVYTHARTHTNSQTLSQTLSLAVRLYKTKKDGYTQPKLYFPRGNDKRQSE